MSATATDDRFWSKVDGADPIGTLILITDDEMRDILTHIAGAGDRVLFDRLHDRWMSLRYGLDLPLTLEGTDR